MLELVGRRRMSETVKKFRSISNCQMYKSEIVQHEEVEISTRNVRSRFKETGLDRRNQRKKKS